MVLPLSELGKPARAAGVWHGRSGRLPHVHREIRVGTEVSGSGVCGESRQWRWTFGGCYHVGGLEALFGVSSQRRRQVERIPLGP